MVPQDAGKDVQCANPECIVPVFKSKRPKVEAPPEEKPKGNKTLMIAGGVVGLIVVGIGIFAMMSSEPDKPVVTDGPIFQPPTPVECDDCKPVECDNCKPEVITPAEIVRESLTKVVDAARERGDHNRNAGTQLAAETLAVGGDIKQAQSELKRLQAAGSTTGYLQVQPFAEIAFAQLKKQDREGAAKTALDGLTRTKNLPPTVRRSLDAATSLAAALIASGKRDEGVQLIADQIAEAEGKLGIRGDSSVLWRAALDSGTYDVGLEASRPYHAYMPESLRVGVIETLIALGFESEARSLIDTATNETSRDSCYAAWAGRLSEMKPATVIQTVSEFIAGGKVSAIAETRMWAAVASHLNAKGKTEGAQTAFTNALTASGKIAAPVPEKTFSMKEIYDSQGKAFLGLQNPAVEESAALAFIDLAIVSTQLKSTEQTAEFLDKGLAYARATTPGPVWTQQKYDECNNQENSVKSQLQSIPGIGSSASQLRSDFIRYRRQCERLNERAQERFRLQTLLLRAVAKSGQTELVWKTIVAQNGQSDPQLKEPYLTTSLPGLLAIQANLDRNNSLRQEIMTAQKNKVDVEVVDRGIAQVRAAFNQKDLKGSADSLRNFYKSSATKAVRDEADIEALGLIADVMNSSSVIETFQYITTLADPVLRQDAFMLFAAETAKRESAPQLWDHLKTPAIRELGALDKASIYRGLVTSIQNPKTAAATGSTTDTTGGE